MTADEEAQQGPGPQPGADGTAAQYAGAALQAELGHPPYPPNQMETTEDREIWGMA